MKFTYLKRDISIKERDGIHFLLPASFYSLPIYFALKGKHDYEMLGAEEFVDQVKPIVKSFAADFDVVVIPESRCPFLRNLTKDLPNVLELRKRSKEEICSLALQTKGWRKADVESARKAWSEMGDTFTINLIKSNKRKDYVSHLFESVKIPDGSKILLFDDFIMSENTIKAMSAAIGHADHQTLGIFYQQKFLKKS
jgi:hypothetical protein